MSKLDLINVTKSFGAQKAVSDVTLSVDEGCFAAVVGPSGCGKTTLLRLVAGLESLSGGFIHLDNQDISHREPGDRDIAMVFQHYALYPHMSVHENMEFPLKVSGVDRDTRKTKVLETASLLGIERLLNKRPREISGGEKQRVAIGRAIVRQPKVFLFDEPLSNLDPHLRLTMRTELKKLHRRLKNTVLYVTHDQAEALILGEKIIVMQEGKVQQIGSAEEVYKRPTNLFVAGFIGSPPMNLIKRSALPDHPLFQNIAHDMIVGVRPEHVEICPADEKCLFKLKVQLIEELGVEKYVHLASDGVELRVRLGQEVEIREGDWVPVMIREEHVHLFRGEEG